MSGLGLKGIIFDLDGTLVDSLRDIATAVNLTRHDYGLPSLPESEITRLIGDGAATLVRQTVPVASDQPGAPLQRYLSHYRDHVLDSTVLFPGIDRLLERVSHVPLGVVTNKTAALAETILRGLDVRQRFDIVLGGDSLPARKPDPEPILHLVNRWHLQPHEVGLVGDGLHDVEAGKAAGVVILGVTWGVAGREALSRAGAKYLLNTVAELEDLLLS